MPEVQTGLDDEASVPISDSVKSLGCVLDFNLSWRQHIVSVVKIFNRILYSL